MNNWLKCAVVLVGMFCVVGCEDLIDTATKVRFRNDSATKTVYAIWDGSIAAELAPGETSDYRIVNPDTHIFQWKNAANNADLSSLSWPDLVEGHLYTFPYSD